MRVVLAGASGFIGTYLAERYRSEGADVKLIGRNGPDASWGNTAAIAAVLEGADLLINLAGKSVNCRYTDRNRAEIFRSRLETTSELARAIALTTVPPRLWLNASTATIYRHSDDRPMTEVDGVIGRGFSVEVATAWEKAFFEPKLPKTRRVALRLAIVLGDGSVMTPFTWLSRFGLGGAQHDGRWFSTAARRRNGTFHEFRSAKGSQRFSWVHLDDVFGAIRFIASKPKLTGVVNVSSPNPTDSNGFMAAVRSVLGVPFGIPTPRWILEIGSFVIRTETELVLKSRWVIPTRLEKAGYVFEHPELEPALRAIRAGGGH